MKSIKVFLFLFLVGTHFCSAQDTTLVLKPSMLDKDSMQIYITEMHGWLFKQGSDTNWSKKNIDLTGWKKMMPTELSEKLADKNGRMEGWFRIKIKLDSTFNESSFGIRISSWAASDLYLDGNRIASFGNTGLNGAPYHENIFISNLLPIPANLKPGTEYSIALHVVDYVSPYPPYHLKAKESSLSSLIRITVPKYYQSISVNTTTGVYFKSILASVSAVLSLFFWLLLFQNRSEKNLLLFALASTFLSMSLISAILANNFGASYGGISFAKYWVLERVTACLIILFFATSPFVLASIFNRRVYRLFKIFLILLLILNLSENLRFIDFGEIISIALIIIFIATTVIAGIYYVVSSWKTLKGAQWAVVVGLMLMLSIFLFAFIFQYFLPESTIVNEGILESIVSLSFPVSLMVYVAMRFKEIIKEVRENAKQVVQMSEEKKEQALNQQKILQEEVNRQTAEISITLENLKSTQSQLIQSEKMASLGELTAGIAHEIQNPLNFVNNFSEVNKELLAELNEEIEKGNYEDVKAIAKDITANEDKINHHGKRADAIVKGMLQHSRSSNGKKEPTDVNALADEYLRLAYHGLRAKDKSFNATMITHFEPTLGKANLVPQDIGRVILNLITNAFYVVNEKKKREAADYEPTITINTTKSSKNILISVRDNGNGIPKNILDKIFQPFFTTKPTGQGTGLGLSLSYDIVKAHGGDLKVETKEGEWSEFIIQIPFE
ncbi:MAG: ATP-binding protein [Bacteroidota bacterium]